MNLTLIKVFAGKLLGTTIEIIKQLAWDAKSQPDIKKKAVRIIQQAGVNDGRDFHQVAVILSDWVRRNIRFFHDPHRTEMLHTPQKTMELKYGDCDDISILLAALLMSVGIEPRFRIVGQTRPEHIYIEALTQDGWIGLDPSRSPDDPDPSTLKSYALVDYRG